MTNSGFLITSEYRRFVEFCESCRRNRYIGVCYGKPGVGKTQSAKQLTRWDLIEPLLGKSPRHRVPPAELANCTIGYYTPEVSATAKRVQVGVARARNQFDELIDQAVSWHGSDKARSEYQFRRMDLLIVDEADRLRFHALEQLRDFYDRSSLGIVLMGMPGIQKRGSSGNCVGR
jgi:DNA transposition AAA+ family ATPase